MGIIKESQNVITIVIISPQKEFVHKVIRNLKGTRFIITGWAPEGESGYLVVKKLRPDIVMIEIAMPIVNNFIYGGADQFLDKLKSDPDCNPKVILLYDIHDKMRVMELLRKGAVSTLYTKFTKEQLLESLESAISSSSGMLTVRRTTPRKRIKLLLRISAPQEKIKNMEVITHDLSPTGVSFMSWKEFKIGSILKMELIIDNKSIYTIGKVKRSQPQPMRGIYLTGVTFSEIKDEDQQFLREYLAEKI